MTNLNVMLVSKTKTSLHTNWFNYTKDVTSEVFSVITVDSNTYQLDQVEAGTKIKTNRHYATIVNNKLFLTKMCTAFIEVTQDMVDILDSQPLPVLKTLAFREQMMLSVINSANPVNRVPVNGWTTSSDFYENILPTLDEYIEPVEEEEIDEELEEEV